MAAPGEGRRPGGGKQRHQQVGGRCGVDDMPGGAEYLHGERPTTPLGQAEAEFLASRGR